MFNKIDEYKKLTITTYPDGNVLHKKQESYDFDNGARVVEKYRKESEKFKLNSVKAQSDISEKETLVDDTLKITIQVDQFAFTVVSAAGFPNVAFAKALAQMNRDQLAKLQEKFQASEKVPAMVDFQEWMNEICETNEALDVAFKAYVHIHDSYTKEHISAIKYIIHSLDENCVEEGDKIVVSSADPDLKNAIIDLGMSTYFDITIDE